MEEIIYQRNLMDIALLLSYLFGIAYLVQRFRLLSKFFFLVAIYTGLIHLGLTFVYYLFTFANVTDATGYYVNTYYNYNSFTDTSLIGGTATIDVLLYPLIHFFSLSYLGCFLVFSFVSLIGIYRLFEILIKINGFKWGNWFYLMLLPSMHYWTSMIGKDALIFFSICSILNAYYFKRSYLKYILPLILIGLIRFYVLALIGAGFFIALIVLSKQIKLGYKIALLGIAAIGVVLITPYFFQSIGFTGIDDVEEKKQIIQRANMIGGSAVDLTNSNIAVKWFSQLFRPTIFEAKNAFGIAAGMENILWLIIFCMIFLRIKQRKVRQMLSPIFWISFVCIFTITLPAAYSISNLGLASRQKIMIVPFLFTVFFMLLKISKSVQLNKREANKTQSIK